MNTYARLKALYNDLGTMGPGETVHWPVGEVFNALLSQAKADHPDDPVIEAIAPVQASSSHKFVANGNAGSLRALTGQLTSAYEASPGPMIS
jgi:hypothetical protein